MSRVVEWIAGPLALTGVRPAPAGVSSVTASFLWSFNLFVIKLYTTMAPDSIECLEMPDNRHINYGHQMNVLMKSNQDL